MAAIPAALLLAFKLDSKILVPCPLVEEAVFCEISKESNKEPEETLVAMCVFTRGLVVPIPTLLVAPSIRIASTVVPPSLTLKVISPSCLLFLIINVSVLSACKAV